MTARALLYLLITLLIGFGLGMTTDRALQTIKKSRMVHRPPEHNFVEDMVRSLELGPGQMDSIKPVLDAFIAQADSTRRMIMEQTEAGMDSLRINLLPLLTDEQILKLDKSGFFRKGPWKRGESPPPGPPPGFDRPPAPPSGHEGPPGARNGDEPPPPPPPGGKRQEK